MQVLCYGASVQGLSHIDGGKPCQDAHFYYTLPNGWTIAAIADGVGSAKHADKGAKMAVNTAVGFCVKNFPVVMENVINDSAYDEMMKSMIRMAFNRAFIEIIKLAGDEKNQLSDYDTTLILVLYDGVKLYYGHVGDSGLFGLTVGGEYQAITKQQKGEDGRTVIPLRFGMEHWEVKSLSEQYVALLLVTDGILEKLIMPGLLKLRKEPLNIYEMRMLMDKTYEKSLVYQINKRNVEDIQKELKNQLERGYYKNVTQDDKTIVALISGIREPEKKESSYYEEPDWEKLKSIQNRLLYGEDNNKKEKRKREEKNTEENIEQKNIHQEDSNVREEECLYKHLYKKEKCDVLLEKMIADGQPFMKKSMTKKIGEFFSLGKVKEKMGYEKVCGKNQLKL